MYSKVLRSTGEKEQGVEEGKVGPKQSTDERSMWAPEGSALQAEGTAPGWHRIVWEAGVGEKVDPQLRFHQQKPGNKATGFRCHVY